MKKTISILSTVMMVSLCLFLTGTLVQAVTYSSGFQVQNLSTTPASINIHYYNQDGTENIPAVGDTIPASGSKTYSTIHAGAGFNGSVVIESDQLITAIANTLGDFPQYGASSNGFSSGATTIRLPLLMKGNSGFNTWFNVQNTATPLIPDTGANDATVNVTYSNGITELAAVIKPGAAKTYNQSANANLPTPFIGSATVTSTQPVVATVMQIGTGNTKVMLAYNSFGSGSNQIQLPLIQAKNSGYFTGVQVMNVGTVPTDITITYGPNTVPSGVTPAPETRVGVLNGTSATFDQNLIPSKYIGGATITNTAAQPIVAIVNQLSLAGKASSYEGIDPSVCTTQAVAPLIMANNSGYFTGLQVQNVGTGNCDITIQYSPNTVTSSITTPTDDVALGVTQGNSKTFLHNTGQFSTGRYIGSATITGTGAGCLVSAIVNEVNLGAAGDQLFTYNATSK